MFVLTNTAYSTSWRRRVEKGSRTSITADVASVIAAILSSGAMATQQQEDIMVNGVFGRFQSGGGSEQETLSDVFQ